MLRPPFRKHVEATSPLLTTAHRPVNTKTTGQGNMTLLPPDPILRRTSQGLEMAHRLMTEPNPVHGSHHPLLYQMPRVCHILHRVRTMRRPLRCA